MILSVVDVAGIREIYWHPGIDIARQWVVEARRHHADHRVRTATHGERLPDRRSIAVEPLAPEPVAQHDEELAVFLFGLEPSSESRVHAHDVEVPGAHG